jgi:hypothetical protein
MKTVENHENVPVIQVEEHPEAETLIIAFTGRAAKFNMIQPFDFFKLTGLLRYHRILLREPWHYSYLKGIDESGFDGLLNRLRSEIKQLAPKRVVVIGVSSGGFASLVFGNLLEADYVHAFSPFTFYSYLSILMKRDLGVMRLSVKWPLTLPRLNFCVPKAQQYYLNLRPSLMKSRGKTRFYVHTCAFGNDRKQAMNLDGCPRTRVFLYPCNSHNVTWGMLKNRCLRELLQEKNLNRTEEIYREFYPNFDPNCKTGCADCRGMRMKESMPVLEEQL